MSNDPWQRPRTRHRSVDYGNYVRRDIEQGEQVLWTLIAINVLVFLLWNVGPSLLKEIMYQNFTVARQGLLFRPWTLLTAAFSQYAAGHLFFNMLSLWIFGREVADALGGRRFLWLYLGGGLASSLAHVVLAPHSAALGSSGAVMAIAVMFGALFPDRTIYLNFLFPVPARILVVLYVALDLFGLLGGGGGIDNAGHLGGAAFGLLFWWLRYGKKRRK